VPGLEFFHFREVGVEHGGDHKNSVIFGNHRIMGARQYGADLLQRKTDAGRIAQLRFQSGRDVVLCFHGSPYTAMAARSTISSRLFQ
jgi:hypothetical protein